MVFSSLLFLVRFLPIVLLLYFVIPRRFKNGLLFFASLIFYAWGEPIYIVLMIFSTLVDYYHGLKVEKYKLEKNDKKAKSHVLQSVITNLALLCFFKYGDFFLQNLNNIFSFNIPLMKLPLPIGISFYTFQTMSYTIDIYRGEAKAQKNIISFGAYVAMFPQLIAGPIVRYTDIAEHLVKKKIVFIEDFSAGVLRFVCGLGKKVLLANNIGILWDMIKVQQAGELSVMTAWLGAFAFTMQIYFDFSGYSDMAIGLGKMFGFRFPENFKYPYEASSISEFWRRWHISLSTWFREYVYIPLGGNRVGKLKYIRNIAIVWGLTGFWHGASWNYVIWGLYFCIILLIEKMFLLKHLKKIPRIFRHLYTIVLILISMVIFAFENFSYGIQYLKVMFGLNGVGFTDQFFFYQVTSFGIMIILLAIGATRFPKFFVCYIKIGRISLFINCYVIFVLLFSIAYLVDATYNPFLYFRF